MQENKVSLSFELINEIVKYLGTKPYQEVFSIMQEIEVQVSHSLNQNKNSETQDVNVEQSTSH